jgi:hypothetical protein
MFDLIESDGSIDQVQKQFLHSALRVVINLIPELEDKLHSSQNESGTYALKALLAEGREIFHDIRALANTQLVALRIAETVVDPAFENIASVYVNTLYTLRNQLDGLVPERERPEARAAMGKIASLFASELETIRNDLKDRIMLEIE